MLSERAHRTVIPGAGAAREARPLSEIAKTIRSKNAGVDKITFDVIFAQRADYDLVRRSGALSRAAVCRIFGIPESRITDLRRVRSGIGD